MRRQVLGMIGLVLLTAAGAGAQRVYKWTDESGRVHFSNIAPAEDAVETRAPEVPVIVAPPPVEDVTGAPSIAEPPPMDEAARDEPPGPYSSLSTDSFSAIVTRKRGEMRRELAATREKIRNTEAELAGLRGKRNEIFTDATQKLQGVYAPEYIPAPLEKQLMDSKKAAEDRGQAIRQEFAELEKEAIKRNGRLPAWWLPLD